MNMTPTSPKSQKLRDMTVLGTRPEIIRLSRIIYKFDKYFDHILVHTGQNFDYDLNQVFFADLGIREPDVLLECAGKTPADTMANVISMVDSVYLQYEPDAVLVLGDTDSSMAAIPAKRRHVPVFHMEAGNRCFDYRVPEEINRKIVDHVADLNMPYSDIARDYLLREGLNPDLIVKTGSPLDEVLLFYQNKIERSDILSQLKLKNEQFFLVSLHRKENLDLEKNILAFVEVLNTLAVKFNFPIIVSTHPRTRKKIRQLDLKFDPLVQFHNPFGFTDYIFLQKSSKAVLSDSGTISEESSILNFPAINIRDTHERPEGMEEGAVMFTGMNKERIVQVIEILEHQNRGEIRSIRKVSDYNAPNVSDKVTRIILSYTDYINKVVWKTS